MGSVRVEEKKEKKLVQPCRSHSKHLVEDYLVSIRGRKHFCSKTNDNAIILNVLKVSLSLAQLNYSDKGN